MSPRDGARPQPAGSIFISYRRDDSADITGRIYDWLLREFPGGKVFKDVDSIPMGDDFRDHMRTALDGCRVVLVVMGREWLDMRGPTGARRLDDPGDYVRLEVEAALQRRPEVKVIPVVVGGGAQPTADRLPESLRDLCFLQTPQLRRDPDFVTDMGRLITRLKTLLSAAPEPLPAPVPPPDPLPVLKAEEAPCLAATESEVAVRSDKPAIIKETEGKSAVPAARRPGIPAGLGVLVLAAAVAGWGMWKKSHPPEETSPSYQAQALDAAKTTTDAVEGIVARHKAEMEAKEGLAKSQPAPEHPAIEGNPFDSGTVGETITLTLPGAVPLKFCYCPAGNFLMGSPESEVERDEDEKQVRVTISKHFWLAQTEFTQAQWEAVMGSNPSKFNGNDVPVETVSWDEAQECIKALNVKAKLSAGWTWALPTEAQWEYACRAGTTTAFSFGATLKSADANFDGNSPYGSTVKGAFRERTASVRSHRPNGWGLYDMHGNVWEWCLDAREDVGDRIILLPGGTDPVGQIGSLRALRGGSYFNYGHLCRAAIRSRQAPEYRIYSLGFRPAAVRAE